MSRYILLICISLFTYSLSAQTLNVNGNIVLENASAEGSRITISKNNQPVDEVTIPKKGRFDLKLALDGDYKLTFQKEGYITKIVNINTEIPVEILESNSAFPPVKLIINLLPHVEGVDLSIFDQPIAIMAYDAELDDFNFDRDYAGRIKDKVAKTEQDVRRILAQKGSAALEKERLFAEYVSKGDNSFNLKKWQDAMDNWNKALTLKPEEEPLKIKIKEAQKENDAEQTRIKLEEQNALRYKQLITSADNFFDLKSYADAKAKYAEAAKINDKEPYPGKRIIEIDQLLANLAKAAEQTKEREALAANYKKLVNEADQFFTGKNYDEAEKKYIAALQLNYEKTYPEQQLKSIAEIRKQTADNLKREADTEANYKKIIAAADNSFNTQDYSNAIKYYTQSLEVKPSEAYPKEMIAKANQAQEDLRKQQEADAEKKRLAEQQRGELMARYNQIIAQADEAFKTENYALAKTRYSEATALNTGEVYPGNKVKEIETIFNSSKYKVRLAEFNKNKSTADKAMQEKNYASAKFYYQKAIDALPLDSENIKKQIAEIEKLIEAEQLAAITKEYNENISKADKAFNEKSYAVARVYYKKALTVKTDDPYALKKLAEVEQLINERQGKTAEF